MEMSSLDPEGAAASSVKSDDSTPPHEGRRGSPPPNCAICLGTCRNKSFTDSCLHEFCFQCLLTWSKVKAECPLCKQNFKSIIHNVRFNHQYEEYMVEQRVETIPDPALDLSHTTRRFRFREQSTEVGPGTPRHSHIETWMHGLRMQWLTLPLHDSVTMTQLLLFYPIIAAGRPAVPERPLPLPLPHSFRRTVYRHNLWARPLAYFTGRYRDCSPEFYRRNDSQMHRLVPLLSRELHYLLNENAGHISYVMARLLELLPWCHINSADLYIYIQHNHFYG